MATPPTDPTPSARGAHLLARTIVAAMLAALDQEGVYDVDMGTDSDAAHAALFDMLTAAVEIILEKECPYGDPTPPVSGGCPHAG